ncbi:LPS export ABC transporter permease LptG [Sphingomonas sp. LB-2]|uniref:LPS export ABC transporter permease LptG n=1 Tax=Sphingomonas caeni TaxID=2984949 RepID=UPI00222E813E|nr:LPS export ABC transporter permease LptG [Sphingomonas caeni]MCW3848286.1 LPS export ABC transporter permease LptG [Sphingomonas caeni]
MNLLAFFPSRTISLYMGKMFIIRTFAVLATFMVVLQSLDLLSESGKILAIPGNGDAEIWQYVGLRLPQIVQTFLPFSVLMGTIITLSQLNQNSEVISLKASGLSAHQVLAPLVVAGFAVAAISFTFNERIVARATASLDAWKKAEYRHVPTDNGNRRNVWVRTGDNLIEVELISGRGNAAVLDGVTVHERDNQQRLVSIVTGVRGTREGQGWRVTGARRFDVASGKQVDLGTAHIGDGVRPDQFTLAKVDADGLDFFALAQAIDDLKEAGRPTKALEGSLWHKLAAPLSSILMPLLGSVAAFGLARSGKLFIRAVIGMALGFLYFVADNFALAMGNLGAYPPWLAAGGPFLLFLAIGEAVLIRTEE